MDPDANLAEQRRLREEILTGSDTIDEDRYVYIASRFAELSEALDEWISKGGALPKEWQRGK